MTYLHSHVAAIIPAHNEAQSITTVIQQLQRLTHHSTRLIDTIVVCDNRSTDNTAALASAVGGKVVYESTLGYGAACLRGIQYLQEKMPDIVIFIDADNSAHAPDVLNIIATLHKNNDLVIGVRAKARQQSKALIWHQRMGTQLACKTINYLWKQSIQDLGPLRAIRFNALRQLNMQDTRYGWTTEMQIKAIIQQLRYQEIEVSTKKRIGASKISGTIRGTLKAAYDIFSTIFFLYRQSK